MSGTILNLASVLDNEEVIEGGVTLNIPIETITEDIEIIFPNKNSEILNKQMLTDSSLTSSDVMVTPSILYPTANMLDFNGKFVITAFDTISTFDGLYSGSILEIAYDENFNTLYKTVETTEETVNINTSIVPENTIFYARVRYVSGNHVSNYSDVVKFTTINSYTIRPDIITPVNGVTGVSRTPFVQLGEYKYVGTANTHESTKYEIATDSEFLNVIKTGNFGPVENFIIDETLSENITYYLRCGYTGVIYGGSLWSETVNFTIKNVLEKVKILNNNLEANLIESIIDNDGNIVGVGYNRVSESANASMYILKYDSDLNILVSKTFNIGTYDDVFEAIALDPNGGYIVAGYTRIDNSESGHAIIMKLDTNFNIITKKQIGENTGFNTIFGLTICADGNIICTGYGSNNTGGAGVSDCVMYKISYDLSTLLYSKRFGGAGYDSLNYVVKDKNSDNYFAVGTYTPSGTYPYHNAVIIKIDSSLNIIKALNFSYNNLHHYLHMVKRDKEGNFIAVGYYYTSGIHGTAKGFVVKFDSNLNVIFMRYIHSDITAYDTIFVDVDVDSENNYHIIGLSDNYPGFTSARVAPKGFIVKLDVSGNIKKTYDFYKYDRGIILRGIMIDKYGDINLTTVMGTKGYVATDSYIPNIMLIKMEKDTDITSAQLINSGMTISSPSTTIGVPGQTVSNITITTTNTIYTIRELTVIENVTTFTETIDII